MTVFLFEYMGSVFFWLKEFRKRDYALTLLPALSFKT